MRLSTLTVAAAGLAVLPGTAFAAHTIVYAPKSDTRATTFAPGNQASIQTRNGSVEVGGNTYVVGPNSAAGSTSDPTLPSYNNAVDAVSLGVHRGQTVSSTATASASLATGDIKSSIINQETSLFIPSVSGTTEAILYDTIWFTNASGADVLLDVILSYDGTLFNTEPTIRDTGSGFATSVFRLSASNCGNSLPGQCNGTPIRYADRLTPGLDAILQASLDGRGNTLTGGAQSGFATFSFHPQNGNLLGFYGGSWLVKILIPTGQTSLGLQSQFTMGCSGYYSCNFNNTMSTRFGPLPDGLTFTSASGQFLTGLGAGAVPEPATWAMMILGFGLIGGAMRQRKGATRVRVAYA